MNTEPEYNRCLDSLLRQCHSFVPTREQIELAEKAEWSTWVGKRVSKNALQKKTQPKPFKSGLLFNTVKSLTVNPNTNKPAFTFIEDESVVDCYICTLKT